MQALPKLSGVSFPVDFIVNPPQEDIPSVYGRGYHALLFGSVYEAWGMPVMEAMASGVPVVTSRCFGVDMFCRDGVNCLTAPPTDVSGLAAAVLRLLRDPTGVCPTPHLWLSLCGLHVHVDVHRCAR